MSNKNQFDYNMDYEEYKNTTEFMETLKGYDQVIDPAKFTLPDMGDFMGDEMSLSYAKTINEHLTGEVEEDVKKNIFYLEKPHTTELGFHPEDSIIVIRPSKSSFRMGDKETYYNQFDGDTLYMNINQDKDGGGIDAGRESFELHNNRYKNPKDYIIKSKGWNGVENLDHKSNILGIRFLGIDAPELPKYGLEPMSSITKTKTVKNEKISSLGAGHTYEVNAKRKKNGTTEFVQLYGNNMWFEVKKKYNAKQGFNYYDEEACDIVITDTSEKDKEYGRQAKASQEQVKSMINKADDILILIDTNTLSSRGGAPDEYNKSWFYDPDDNKRTILTDIVQKAWDDITNYRANMYSGFNAFGMDAYRRFLGAVYLKMPKSGDNYGGEWINLAKYIATLNDKVVTLPDFTSNPYENSQYGFVSNAFKMWTYDRNQNIVDALLDISDINDRKKIQEKVFGRNYESLTDWTITIGDATFLIPPTAIKFLISSPNERTPLLRSRGSATKSNKKDSRTLQIDLYFNEERGINGYPVLVDLPGYITSNGETNKIRHKYYLNGLRALISMFKFTPFLPIENKYINDILNIEAVSLVSMNVESVPSMPRTLKATLILQEFDYRVYMPELPIPEQVGLGMNANMFAHTINYEVMRYYYQRPILRGEEIKNIPINSDEYIEKTLGDRTALQPMKFNDPYIHFYRLDENFLRRKMQSYLEREKRGVKHLHKYTEEYEDYRKNYLAPFVEKAFDASNNIRNLLDDNSTKLSSLCRNNVRDLTEFRKALSGTGIENNIEKIDFKYESVKFTDGSKMSITPILYIKMPIEGIRPGERKNNFENYCEELGLTKDTFKNSQLIFKMRPDSNSDIKSHKHFLEIDNNSLMLMELVASQKRRNDYQTMSEKQQETVQDINRGNDIESETSLRYEKIKIPPTIVTRYNVLMSNTFNNISLQMSNGYAPQYLGGQDIKFEVEIETSNEEIVTMLSALPREIAMTVREYREILTVYPIRVDTEFTRFFGCNEVVLESVEVDTESSPEGVLKKHWLIRMVLVSVDRTVRNRERLKDIENKKHSGGTSGMNRPSLTQKTFWDLKSTLAKAEVYPDLELPTINELERLGFKFIRYSNAKVDRVFPDPDFYFYYGHLMMNEILRSGIDSFLGDEVQKEEVKFELKDSSGAAAIMKYDSEDPRGFSIPEVNGKYKDDIEANARLEEVVSNSKAVKARKKKNERAIKENEYLNDLLEVVWRAVNGDTWNISDDILVSFREDFLLEPDADGSNNNLYNSMEERTKEAISIIDGILSKKPSFKSVSISKSTLEKEISKVAKNGKDSNFYKKTSKVWDSFSKTDDGQVLIRLLNLKNDSGLDPAVILGNDYNKINFDITVSFMIAAIAASRTGIYEFDGSKDTTKKKSFLDLFDNSREKSWKGEVPSYCLSRIGKQGLTDVKRAITIDEVVNYGFLYSAYGIEEFDSQYIENITGEKPKTKRDKYFIDPYYRDSATEEEIKELRATIVCNEDVAIQIACREMLFWLKKLLEKKSILTMFDLMQEGILAKLKNVDEYIDLTFQGSIGSTIDELDEELEENMKNNAEENYDRSISGLQVASKKKLSKTLEAVANIVDGPREIVSGAFQLTKAISSKGYETVSYFARGIRSMLTSDEEKKEELEAINEQVKADKEHKKELEKEKKRLRKDLEEIRDTLMADVVKLQMGKVFLVGLVTSTYGDSNLLELIENKDYDTLNSLTLDISSNLSGKEQRNEESMKIVKYIRALAGYNVISNPEKIGDKTQSTKDLLVSNAMSRIYISAAENPALYLKHSFYDMVVNDKRGRMARAFPTFYMLFVDEGREIGWWKLHDNFYNMSSISSFNVVKSRKIAADTAVIQMNNMFQTFDRYDDDLKDDDQYTFTDFFTSIFSPRTYYIKEEIKRLQQEPINKFLMKPGIRMHLRMGYGSNASTLPIVFNGTITDVQQGDVIELVAQGDGVELTNAITFDYDAEDVKHQDKIPGWRFLNTFFTRGATPKTILTSLLNTEGGPFRYAIKHLTRKRLFNESPLGIVHFGDKEFKDIFPEGEVCQNLYEATSKPSWAQGNKSKLSQVYSLKDAPKLSMDIFDKTFWDVMHVCSSASPDFISAIAPFNFRSTIFHGRPRYYYAFDYEKIKNSSIIEKRKPYQQYHIYTSYSDIIENRIIATENGLSTCAVGLYDKAGVGGREKQQKLSPMWVDINVYPEKQKTMTVDTQLLFKGTPILGDVIPYYTALQTRWADDKGVMQGGHSIAWRMTANSLKSSMKDMYRGELLIIGDPSVKPHDRIYITDLYEKMSGSVEVEAVVHSFDINTGFVTHIHPDLISTIDDPHENINQTLLNNMVTKSIGSYLTLSIMAQAFAGKTKPLATIANSMIRGNSVYAEGFMNTVNSILGKDNDITSGDVLQAISNLEDKLNLSSTASTYEAFIKYGQGSIGETLEMIDLLDKAKDAEEQAKLSKKILQNMNNLDPSHLIKEVDKLKEAGEFVEADEVLNALNRFKSSYDNSFTKILNSNETKNSINNTIKLFSNSLESLNSSDKEIASMINALNNTKNIKSMDELMKIEKMIEYASINFDDVEQIKDIAKDFENIKKTIASSAELTDITKGIKETEGLSEALDIINENKYNLATKSVASGLIVQVILAIMVYAAKGTITSMLERLLKSYQVLQIFPLMKNGKVLTAGMDGSKGVIVGSPRYNDKGAVDGFISKLYDYNEWDGIGKVIPFIVNYFSSTGMQEAAQKSIKKQNTELSQSMLENNTSIKLLERLAVSEVRKNDAYHASVITPRVQVYHNHDGSLNEDGKLWFHRSAVLTTDNIEKNDHIKDSTIAIEQYDLLDKYIDNEMLVLAHNNSSKAVLREFNIGGENISLSCIEENGTIDIPVLREDCLLLINEIMIKVNHRLKPNSMKYEENIKKHPVILQSCFRAGAKNLSSTGLSFTITATDMEDFEDILVEIITEQETFFEAMGSGELKFFEYKKNNDDRTTFLIEVLPPYSISDISNKEYDNTYSEYEKRGEDE